MPTPTLDLAAAGRAAAQVITDQAVVTLTGVAAPGAVITLSGGLGSVVADANGAFSLTIPVGSVPATGTRLSLTATATGGGAATATTPITVWALPTPDGNGIVQTSLDSKDIAAALEGGFSLQLAPGTEAINLVDGVLSVGTDTQEALVQRLYEGLFDRSYDPAGMEHAIAALAAGAALVDVISGFLASPEYVHLPSQTDLGFVSSLYRAFLGRPATDSELGYWSGAIGQGLSRAQIVGLFVQTPEAKSNASAETTKVFERDETATSLNELYETALGREAQPGEIVAMEPTANASGLGAVAALLLQSPEGTADHAGQGDAAFVTSLYTAGLGRAPTASELAAGTGALASGATRGAVLAQVASSAGARSYLSSDDFGAPPEAILVGGQVTPQPTVVLASTGQAAIQAVADQSTVTLSGSVAPGAVVTLSGGYGSAIAGADGSFSIAVPLGTVPQTGLRLSLTATATLAGDVPSVTSLPVSLFVLPPADGSGVVQTDLSSKDLAGLLNAGFSLQLSPGTEAINLVDGVLSVGGDTQEAYVARLYEGLLGRAASASEMEAAITALGSGGSIVDTAAGLLGSAEYLAKPQLSGDQAFIKGLYAGFLNRAPSASELTYWSGVVAQGLTEPEIVGLFDQTPEDKQHNLVFTGKLFARNETETAVHELFETVLGREADVGGLATWVHIATGAGLAATADFFLQQPEAAGHAAQGDAAFVGSMYAAAVGRAPSAAELAAATGQLAAGTSRGTFLVQLLGGAEARAHLTSDAFGQPPVLAAVAPVKAVEGAAVPEQLAATDPDGTGVTYSLVSGPAGAAVNGSGGLFTMMAPGTPGVSAVTVAATDPTGLSVQTSFTVQTVAVAPSLLMTMPAAAIAGTATVASLSGGGRVSGWTVDWGDGSAPSAVSGDVVEASHVYAEAGQYRVRAAGTTADGVFAGNAVGVTVAAATLVATGVVAEQTGFHARYNGVLNTATLSVVADAAGDAPSVIVTGPGGALVAGSLVPDADGAGFRFVAASGVLAAGTYGVVVRGTVQDDRARSLDGAGVGVGGNDERFTVTVPVGDSVSAPSFMRGPGQAVGVPANGGSALPVSFTSGGEATSLVFTALYNPALLAVSGAVAGSGLPAGATIGFTTQPSNGMMLATVTVTSPTPIPSGTVPLVMLQASVPATAPYGSTEALTLAITSVNGVAEALPPSSAVQVVGYLGDADGDGAYTANDKARILRVVGGADRSFAVWSGVAPAIVADLNGDGAVTAADAALVGTAAVPTIPSGVTLVANSVAPFVSLPATVSAAPGTVVTLPVTIDRSTVLANGSVTVAFDASSLELVAVRADPASGLTVSSPPQAASDTTADSVIIAMVPPVAPKTLVTVTVSQTPGRAVTGVLALFDFMVAGTVQPGSDLGVSVYAVSLNGQALLSEAGSDGTVVVAQDTADAAGDALSRMRAARARLLAGAAV